MRCPMGRRTLITNEVLAASLEEHWNMTEMGRKVLAEPVGSSGICPVPIQNPVRTSITNSA
jgi:hypothetical protein